MVRGWIEEGDGTDYIPFNRFVCESKFVEIGEERGDNKSSYARDGCTVVRFETIILNRIGSLSLFYLFIWSVYEN